MWGLRKVHAKNVELIHEPNKVPGAMVKECVSSSIHKSREVSVENSNDWIDARLGELREDETERQGVRN